MSRGGLSGPEKDLREYLEEHHVGAIDAAGVEGLLAECEDLRAGRIKAVHLPYPVLEKAVNHGLAPGEITFLFGPPGAAKTWMALNILWYAWHKGVRWHFLPMEDQSRKWVRRMLAIHIGDWRMMERPGDDSPEERARVADFRKDVITQFRAEADEWFERIHQNPWMPVRDGSEKVKIIPPHYGKILRFVEDASKDCELVAVDPISQIVFSSDGKKDYEGQQDFIQHLTGIAVNAGVHVLLVAHTIKQSPGMSRSLMIMQGSNQLEKLAHNSLALVRHDPEIESNIFSQENPVVAHRLVLDVKKTREGPSGDQIAFDLKTVGPRFKEYGVIKQETKRGGWIKVK